MAAKDQETRRLAAIVAANTRRAYPDRVKPKAPVPPASVLTRYEELLDPSCELAPEVRRKRAAAAWRADEAQAALDARRAALRDGGDDGGAAA